MLYDFFRNTYQLVCLNEPVGYPLYGPTLIIPTVTLANINIHPFQTSDKKRLCHLLEITNMQLFSKSRLKG